MCDTLFLSSKQYSFLLLLSSFSMDGLQKVHGRNSAWILKLFAPKFLNSIFHELFQVPSHIVVIATKDDKSNINPNRK